MKSSAKQKRVKVNVLGSVGMVNIDLAKEELVNGCQKSSQSYTPQYTFSLNKIELRAHKGRGWNDKQHKYIH